MGLGGGLVLVLPAMLALLEGEFAGWSLPVASIWAKLGFTR